MSIFDIFRKKKKDPLRDLPPAFRQAFNILFPNGQRDLNRQLDSLCAAYGAKYKREEIHSNLIFILSGYLISGEADTKDSSVQKVMRRQVNTMHQKDIEYLYDFALSNHPKLAQFIHLQTAMDEISEDGCETNTIPGGVGMFGYSSENPIPAHGVIGIHEYFKHLRDKNGNPVSYERIGTVNARISNHPIDVYVITSLSISSKVELYISAYHKRNSQLSPADFILVDNNNIVISTDGSKFGLGQICNPNQTPKPQLTALGYFGVIDSKELNKYPDNIIDAENLNRQGFIMSNSGNTEAAINLLNRAINRGSINAINSLFAVLHSAERYQEAYESLLSAIRDGHRSAACLFNLAVIYSGYDTRYNYGIDRRNVISCLRQALELEDNGLEEYRSSIQKKALDFLKSVAPSEATSILSNNVRQSQCEFNDSTTSTRIEKCTTKTDALPNSIQEIISAAKHGLMFAKSGYHNPEQKHLLKMFNLVQDSCHKILQIPTDQYNLVGSAFSLMLSYSWVNTNENVARAIADYAFFCISKAINNDPSNENLHIKRLSILAETRDYFFYTIANAMDLPDYNPFDFMASMPLMVRTNSYLFAIVKYDLSYLSNKTYDGAIGNLIEAANKSLTNDTSKDGCVYIDKIMTYLINTFKKY